MLQRKRRQPQKRPPPRPRGRCDTQADCSARPGRWSATRSSCARDSFFAHIGGSHIVEIHTVPIDAVRQLVARLSRKVVRDDVQLCRHSTCNIDNGTMRGLLQKGYLQPVAHFLWLTASFWQCTILKHQRRSTLRSIRLDSWMRLWRAVTTLILQHCSGPALQQIASCPEVKVPASARCIAPSIGQPATLPCRSNDIFPERTFTSSCRCCFTSSAREAPRQLHVLTLQHE